MYGIAYTVFMIGISYSQINPDILRGHYINGTVLAVLAFFLSAILYSSKARDFISRKTIEKQKAELEQANRELSQTNHELQESLIALDESQSMIFTLTLALESKDQNTHGHSERVVDYAMALADYLALNEKDKTSLSGFVIHDVGSGYP
jgi:HD-GYP domain-containing protein (c-di-GMP phosphodiesterase class II)